MYELLVLGALMVHDRTGYKLRQILEGNLDTRRKISNGVMYPVLHKLEQDGYITLSKLRVEGREQKLASITDAGRVYFEELMHQPIPNDAKREATYRFKIRAMGRETVGFQRAVLTDYQTIILQDLKDYQTVTDHLLSQKDNPERQVDIGWNMRAFDLAQAINHAKLTWVNEQLAALDGLADDDHFTTLPITE
ncbi:transcriptional regulator [Secundilactobacillus kimchicus]|uniref:PadR family transcriptional regulator n=1 Tax=Secundilactobacillus kimchicus TaxID=528209 RepID=UPI001C031C00|nr:PadR family transcriptional regulator [Secundilactobacillus kimchicus]MBT9671122.1 transcriptional regulator [Secundilactobacillus kimchicus]